MTKECCGLLVACINEIFGLRIFYLEYAMHWVNI